MSKIFYLIISMTLDLGSWIIGINEAGLMEIGRTSLKIASLAMLLFIVACSKSNEPTDIKPIKLDRSISCAVCGMIPVDFPGAKGQIHYSSGKVDSFCSTLDMFTFYLQPDRPKNISAVFVNDMGKADDWYHPEGHWINGIEAHYVLGGDIMGPMGEALVPFSELSDARSYVEDHGGKVARFDDVEMGMLRPSIR
jgi:copper chaperone NosL